MLKIERIICGDNLDVLKKLESESVDLCYIDPPFFSGRNYAVIFGDEEETRQFTDRWVKMNEKGKYTKDINVYLNWMEPRLKEIRRILKKTGVFWLHCDKNANAYLKVLCDHIFGYNRFINEIIWQRTTGQNTTKGRFKSNHDTILFYSKSNKFLFNTQYDKINDRSGMYKYTDEKGKFRAVTLIKKTGAALNHLGESRYFPTEDKTVKLEEDRGWLWNQNKINKFVENGGSFYWSKKGTPNYKKYADGLKPADDIWLNMTLHGSSKERLGYPTQKPEALLERIIKASSNEGDVVLDCFCGCGTTLSVSKKLNRQFIGIDVSPTSCRLMADRIGKPHRNVEGLPLTTEEIKELSGWEYQNFVIREFGAINGKKGADGGIDGMYYDIPIQVKKYKAGRNDLDTFSGALLREDKKHGVYIALSYTSTFIKEVNRLKRDNEIIIDYYTTDDILEGKHKDFVLEQKQKHGVLW